MLPMKDAGRGGSPGNAGLFGHCTAAAAPHTVGKAGELSTTFNHVFTLPAAH